jgi:hypothetical protein
MLPAEDVIQTLGIERAIEVIGVSRVLDTVGLPRVIEASGAEKVLAELLARVPPEQFQEMVRRLQQRQ